MVVNGSDGLDEITTTGISYIAELKNNKVFSYEINKCILYRYFNYLSFILHYSAVHKLSLT